MDSWLKSYRENEDCKRMHMESYFRIHRPLFTEIVSKSQIVIVSDEEDHIYGYAIYNFMDEIPVIHWAYIKYPFRKMGLLQLIIDELNPEHKPIVCTFTSKVFEKIEKKYNAIYNPLLRSL